MIRTVGVVGAGTMGRGIAQACLQRGFTVVMSDASKAALSGAPESILAGLEKAASKGILPPEQARRAGEKLTCVWGLEGLGGADLAIEAVSEDLPVKREIFRELDGRMPPQKTLATNTSSLSVAAIAAATRHPERVLGTHFFNPVPAMKLVELVRTPRTGEEHLSAVLDFLKALGKIPVSVRDTPGFIVNRVFRPFYVRACEILSRGGATAGGVDRAVREIGGAPMGPFELMDLIGLDVNLAITRSLYEAAGRPERFKPPELQRRLVESGQTGRKSAIGFYVYRDGKIASENPVVQNSGPAALVEPWSAGRIWEHIWEGVVAEARLAHAEGVAAKEDIDTAIKLGTRLPHGPFEYARQTET